jgi:hypothetical protein
MSDYSKQTQPRSTPSSQMNLFDLLYAMDSTYQLQMFGFPQACCQQVTIDNENISREDLVMDVLDSVLAILDDEEAENTIQQQGTSTKCNSAQ